MSKFADVILPLPLPGTFTYSIPSELEGKVFPGCRVTVPFGAKKSYTALVTVTHDNEPKDYAIKPLKEVLDETPIILEKQVKLWNWISKYYLCSLGDIYKAAIPQGLKGEFKPRTEQRVRLAAEYRSEKWLNLLMQTLGRAPRQKRLLLTFMQEALPFSENPKEISKHRLIELAQVQPPIYKQLQDKGVFETYEVEIGRLGRNDEPCQPVNTLNPAQQKAFDEIKESFAQKT